MNCQCTKGGQCNCGLCTDLSHQGRLFDVDAEPFSWLLVLQLAAGWTTVFCVIALLVLLAIDGVGF